VGFYDIIMGWRGGKEKTPQKATNVALANKKTSLDHFTFALWRRLKFVIYVLCVLGACGAAKCE
jgi:hypothetical protein